MNTEIEIKGINNKDYINKIINDINDFLQLIIKYTNKNIIEEVKLKKIIITNDYCKTINEIENDGNNIYDSQRYKNLAIAKIVKFNDNTNGIVFDLLYYIGLRNYGIDVSFYYLAHEFGHLINKYEMADITDYIDNEGNNNLKLIKNMYDEYSVFRFASNIVEKPYSEAFKNYILDSYNSFVEELNNKDNFYNLLLQECLKVQNGLSDNIQFFKNCGEAINSIFTDIVYIFAKIDSFDFIKKEFNKNSNILFVNNYALKWIDRYRFWYENKKVNVCDGLEEFIDFYNNLGAY